MSSIEALCELAATAADAAAEINRTPGEETDPEIFEQMLYDGFLDVLDGCSPAASEKESTLYRGIAEQLVIISRDALVKSTLIESERLFDEGMSEAFVMIADRDTPSAGIIRDFLQRTAAEYGDENIGDIARSMIERLPAPADAGPSHPLHGKTVVFTGKFDEQTREEAETLAKTFGAVAERSVTKKTDYLVVGDKPGSKLEKAKTLGTKILTENEWRQLTKKNGPAT